MPHSEEILGLRLVSLHNVYFFLQLMGDVRAAIAEDRFVEFKKDFSARYNGKGGLQDTLTEEGAVNAN